MTRRIDAACSSRDYGCMLRAYSPPVVDAIASCQRALDLHPGARLPVRRPRRPRSRSRTPSAQHGESKYSLWTLFRLQFDLMTGFSAAPLRLFTLVGVGMARAFVVALRCLILPCAG